MPTIEKVKETWTSSSITTWFRLCSKINISSLPLQSPLVGFSWSLTLMRAPSSSRRFARPPNPSMCQFFFNNSNDCHSSWCGSPVNIKLSFLSHPDGDPGNLNPPLSATSTTLVLERGNLHPLAIAYPIDNLADALVSLEVTFTSLQACNLFHVFSTAVPHTPASVREPSIPQTRAALRALERSLETGTSFDTIFQTYACRLSPGKVTRPTPTYANTTVLQETTPLPDFGTYYSCLLD